MRINFLLYSVLFAAFAGCLCSRDSRKKRDLLVRTKRVWVLSTFELYEELNVTYPHFLARMYNNKVEGKEYWFEISGKAVEEGYLTIDEKSGDVYVNKRIDRELIKDSLFHVIFDVYDRDTSQKIDKELAFNVVIKDINDNPPKFTHIPEDVTVDENQEEGLLGVEVIAFDPDEKNTINSRFNISVIAQHPPEPKIQTKWMDERIVHLNFTGCFNYEKENKYNVTLQAKDHGDPPMSSTAEIMINVVDKNTNMPVFKEREYQTKASEMETHDDLLRLAVDDKDTPNTDGWRAKYFFISGNEEDIFKLETDPITNEGILSIIKEKNYEKNSLVDLQIGVENIEPFSKCENGTLIKQGSKLYPPDSVSVKVLMIDYNDPPEFQKTKVYVFEKEESDPGKVLFTPEVHDPDSTSFRFVLVEDPANWVSVDEKTGEIRTTKKMDRESPFVDADNVYKVVIAAIDDGDPPATSSCTISIHLRDTNDHKPQLVNNSLIMCGNENNKVMLSVYDLDADPYSGPFHFSLDNDEDKKHWKLDPYYGQQGGLVSLNPLSYGNYSIALVIEDQQNNIGRETLELVVCDCENNTCRVKEALSIHLGVPAIGSMIAGLLLFLILLLAFLPSTKEHQLKHMEDEGSPTLVQYNEEGRFLKPNAPSASTGPNPIKQTNKTVKSATSSERSLNKKPYNSGAMGISDSLLKESKVKTKTEMTSINTHHKPNLDRSHTSHSMSSTSTTNKMNSNKDKSERDPFSRVRSDIPDQIKMRSEMNPEFYYKKEMYRLEHTMEKQQGVLEEHQVSSASSSHRGRTEMWLRVELQSTPGASPSQSLSMMRSMNFQQKESYRSQLGRSTRSEMHPEFDHNEDLYRSEHTMNKSIDRFSSARSDLQLVNTLVEQIERDITAILELDNAVDQPFSLNL